MSVLNGKTNLHKTKDRIKTPIDFLKETSHDIVLAKKFEQFKEWTRNTDYTSKDYNVIKQFLIFVRIMN